MWRYIIMAGAITIAALQAPGLFGKVMDARENSQSHSQQRQYNTQQNSQQYSATGSAHNGARKQKKFSGSRRSVRINADSRGHYYAQVQMNNRPVKVLVDTGATTVAINETTARKIGIHLKNSDFKFTVNTANGTTKMATAMINEIKIGNIKVRNVRAGVARDSSLSSTLLGMSFLNKLKRFEISGDLLLLEQ